MSTDHTNRRINIIFIISSITLILLIIEFITFYGIFSNRPISINGTNLTCNHIIRKNTQLWNTLYRYVSQDRIQFFDRIGTSPDSLYSTTYKMGIIIKIDSSQENLLFYSLNMIMTPISISFQDNFLIEEPIGLNNCGYDLNPNNQNDILPFKLTFVSSSDLFSHMVFSDSISISRATIKPEKFFFINPDFSPDQKFFTFKIEGIYNPPTIKTPVVGQKINLRIASETNDENTMTSNLTECPPSWPLKTVYIAAAYSIKNSIHELKIRNYIPFNTEFEDIFLKPIDSIIIKPMVLDTLPQAYKTWHQNFIRRN